MTEEEKPSGYESMSMSYHILRTNPYMSFPEASPDYRRFRMGMREELIKRMERCPDYFSRELVYLRQWNEQDAKRLGNGQNPIGAGIVSQGTPSKVSGPKIRSEAKVI